MSWDEKALTEGEMRFINGNTSISTWNDQARQEVLAQTLADGARWQREQLQSDESVKRLADFLHDEDHGETLTHHEKVCTRLEGDCGRRESYERTALGALRAVVGES
ncbi:hypothetical protein [Brevibacterium sp.]|uniref:hypothetical protein n=1 Tax=Brevibacterium sp. TaxID=1701 RepID=UPI0028119B03|nr:hypothetical protein [Brevibacterium sp.]